MLLEHVGLEPEARPGGEGRQLDVLPDPPRGRRIGGFVGAREVLQHAPLDLVRAGRRADLRQLLAVRGRRDPAAVDEHVASVGELERLHHVVADAPAEHLVVEEHRVALEELAAQLQALFRRRRGALLGRLARLPVAERDERGAAGRGEREGPGTRPEGVS